MTEVRSPDVADGTRLVRFLSGLALSRGQISHERYAERLGELIDLSHSISIAKVQSELSSLPFEPKNSSGEAVVGQFLRARYAIIQSVIQSFAPSDDLARIPLPNAGSVPPEDQAEACEPYLQFYRSHQREISFRIQRLHTQIRELVSGLSPALAQLAALDAVLVDTLTAPVRKSFAVVPKLLGVRARQLLRDYRQDAESAMWSSVHERICTEMQVMLLAEVDARLQPVLGLIEAINDNTDMQEL